MVRSDYPINLINPNKNAFKKTAKTKAVTARNNGVWVDISMQQLNNLEGFWGSVEGIGMRLEMLSGALNTASYNNTLQLCAPVYGVHYFKLAGSQPECEYCIKYYGRIYRQGMFMPEVPAHPFCSHLWEVGFPCAESEFVAFWNQTSNLNSP